jgi:hypothetical protein
LKSNGTSRSEGAAIDPVMEGERMSPSSPPEIASTSQ